MTIVKCTNCGATANVNPSNLDSSKVKYRCSKCGQEFKTEFFDCCPSCHKIVGFFDNGKLEVDGETLLSIGMYFGKMFLNPLNGLKTYQYIDANGAGICPICNMRFIRCCKCNELTQIPKNLKITEETRCAHCGQGLYPQEVQEGMGSRHSKEFYII